MAVPFPPWVPPPMVEVYKEKGIVSLLPWQASVLGPACSSASLPLLSSNILFTAPTSAGKSVVAELLALSALLRGLRVLFVLPYISVAREKQSHLQRLLRSVDLSVASFMGAQSAPPAGDWNAAVCTIEKANGLVNACIADESGTLLERLGIIVLDEVHMVWDSSRGVTLDGLAAKLQWAQRRRTQRETRVVAMSATLTGVDAVGRWLSTSVIRASHRPVELDESIAVEGERRTIQGDSHPHHLEDQHSLYPDDCDKAIGWTLSAMARGQRVVVFCSSKAEVEKTALAIARCLHGLVKANSPVRLHMDNGRLLSLKGEMERKAVHLDPLLLKTLPRAVAFHHAGLTTEERESIEAAFSSGSLRILVATSTLSSGVNLPADRVVIRAQVRGPAALTPTTYRQMAGRAGRLGQVNRGESIVVCQKFDAERVKAIVAGSGEETTEGHPRDAAKIVLEAIATSLCSSLDDVSSLLSSLLCPQTKTPEKYIQELEEQKMITHCTLSGQLSATQLGRAALASSLPPEAAIFVFTDLQTASRALALDTELHMLYLVTPINYTVWAGIDWNNIYTIHTKLSPEEKRVARLVGVSDRFILRRLQGCKVSEKEERSHQVHLRFFSALALFDVISEKPLSEVATRYKMNRGSLQTLQYQSATYAAMVVAFCSRLGWSYLKSLLDSFASRLAFGVRAELTELVRVEGIDGVRARAFHQADISSLADLAQSTLRDISRVLTAAVPFDGAAANDGLGEWLFGEPRMVLEEAAATLRKRASLVLRAAIAALGVSPDLVKFACRTNEGETKAFGRTKEEEDDKENVDLRVKMEQESCPSSGYGSARDSVDSKWKKEDDPGENPPHEDIVKDDFDSDGKKEEGNIDIFSQSMQRMTIDDVDEGDEGVEEEEVEDLETSLVRTSRIHRQTSSAEHEDSFFKSVILERKPRTGSFPSLSQNSTVADSFDESVVEGEDKDHRRSERRSILGQLRREQEAQDRKTQTDQAVEEDVFEEEEKERPEDDDSFLHSVVFYTQVRQTATVVEEDDDDDCSVDLFNESTKDTSQLPSSFPSRDSPHSSPLRPPPLFASAVSPKRRSHLVESPLADPMPPTTRSAANRKRERRQSRVSLIASSPSLPSSPTTASPLAKQSRKTPPFKKDNDSFSIIDVCSSLSTWEQFVLESKEWKVVVVALGFQSNRSSEVLSGLAVMKGGGGATEVFYVPLTHDDIYGTEGEESLAPSSTQLHSISIEDRKAALSSLLSSAPSLVLFDALRDMGRLRSALPSLAHSGQLTCLSYLAFLSHTTTNDGPVDVREVSSSLYLPSLHPLLSSHSPRLRSSGVCWLCAVALPRLRSTAERLSSTESVSLEVSAVGAIDRMVAHGFGFSQSKCDEKMAEMRERLGEMEREAATYAGKKKQLNMESPLEVADLLFHHLALPFPGGSGGNKRHLQTNKAILQQLTSLHPLPPLILEYRRVKHALSQCLLPLRHCIPSSSTGDVVPIHTSFNLFSATGRVLSSHPNIQNVGKDPVLPSFSPRQLFVPIRKGCRLLSADFSQLELRVLAYLSGDTALRSLLNKLDDDIFTRMAEEWKQPRQTVKAVCYGIIYGMGARTLGEKLDCSREEGQKMINNFFASFPKTRSYIDRTNEEGAARGYVTTALGRRRTLPSHGNQADKARLQRQAINFTIQGTASEIFKSALLRVEKAVEDIGGRIVMQVHDEIIVEMPSSSVSEAEVRVKEAMGGAAPHCTVALPVKVAIGDNWAELK